MNTIKVTGGVPLSGTVTPVANKNAILKMIPAAILTSETVVLKNVPKTSDVRSMLKIFKKLGGTVKYSKDKVIHLNARNIVSTDIGSTSARAALVFLGPLLARCGEAHILRVGGCELGVRQTDTHFDNFKKMGAKIDTDDGGMHLLLKENNGGKIWQDEPGVTPTENLILLSVLAKGKTEIYNAACEPHIQDLCNMLNHMGAKISGIGTNLLEIEGVESLHGVEYKPLNDHIDVAGLIGIAALTKGEILIKDAEVKYLDHILWVYEKLGIKCEIRGNDIFVSNKQKMEIDKTYIKNEIQCGPWPKFPVDAIPAIVPVALACKGSIIIHNWMYENGLAFCEELKKFGARLIIADPHRVITSGPTNFVAASMPVPYIIQAAIAIFYTALAAEGTSVLSEIDPIGRRYEDFVGLYKSLGAKIEIVR